MKKKEGKHTGFVTQDSDSVVHLIVWAPDSRWQCGAIRFWDSWGRELKKVYADFRIYSYLVCRAEHPEYNIPLVDSMQWKTSRGWEKWHFHKLKYSVYGTECLLSDI